MNKEQQDTLKKIYKWEHLDFGLRLTGLVVLSQEQAIGTVFKGLYYDSSEYPAITPRYVVISKETLDKEWVEVEDPDEIPEGRW